MEQLSPPTNVPATSQFVAEPNDGTSSEQADRDARRGRADPKIHPEARRMRALRRAEGYGDSATRFAHYLGWTVVTLSSYETGFRRVPRDAALQLYKKIPGFDPLWLWTGEEKGLTINLRDRLRTAEAEESR
jgi:DNA-binding transcriptional regulator YiaG